MAYRDPDTLTCPSCKRTGELVWIVGEGPNTQPGQGPAYSDVLEHGGWQVETRQTSPQWQGEIKCPTCGMIVQSRP